MRILTLILIFMSFSAIAEVTEMRMNNQADGYVALTKDECNFEEIKATYPYRAYATEKNVSEVHEGCWVSPSLEDAPNYPGLRLIPIINTWWETGERATFTVEHFVPYMIY